MMVYYLLYSPRLGTIYEFIVDDSCAVWGFRDYRIIYCVDTDRMIVMLRGLGRYLGVFDAPEYIDVECKPSTTILDALSNLLKYSIILYEER